MTRDSEDAVTYAVVLLSHYGFDLKGYTAQELVNQWLKKHQPNWIALAVIEALYQGRYKAVSVEQILTVWDRRGLPIYRFNHEFERLICRKVPHNLLAPIPEDSRDLNPETSLLPLTDHWLDSTETSLPEEPIPTPLKEQESPPTTTIEATPETAYPPSLSVKHTPDLTDYRSVYLIDSPRLEANKTPIQQFTPLPDYSGFYLKLKKVAEEPS